MDVALHVEAHALMVVLVTAPAVVMALAKEVPLYVPFSLTSCTQASLGAT